MGSKELKNRSTWQKNSGKKAKIAEHDFYNVFLQEFKNTKFVIRESPQEFTNIYVDVELDKKVLEEIYIPEEKIETHGIVPDYAIDNTQTQKTIYVEVKRQDGWVEGGKRQDGRGNAHERSCKYFTPGLLKILKSEGNLGNDVLPFWTVFIGNITRDPCRVKEITQWYAGCEEHYFMWRDTTNSLKLINHFNKNLKKLLL